MNCYKRPLTCIRLKTVKPHGNRVSRLCGFCGAKFAAATFTPHLTAVMMVVEPGKNIGNICPLNAIKRKSRIGIMTSTEIDAAEVLRSYLEVLNSGTSIIRDTDELPYPKPIISSVLEHCLGLDDDEPTAVLLRAAYLSLADFQLLSDDQRQAICVMESDQGPSTLSDKDLQQTAVRIAKLGNIYQELQSKISSEIETLNRKLDEFIS